MAKYSKEQESLHKEYIRALLLMNPHITILEAKKKLFETEALRLDKDYVHKLITGVQQEKADEKYIISTTDLVKEIKDEEELAKKFLWDIASNPKCTMTERISALREIRTWSGSLFDRMVTANIPMTGVVSEEWHEANRKLNPNSYLN